MSIGWPSADGPSRNTDLALLFRRTNFQLMLLLDEKTSSNVIAAIDMLEDLCGDAFPKIFPVILCDRGTEFENPERLEHSRNARPHTKVYYCDPQQSQQKPQCEKTTSRSEKCFRKELL